MHNSIQIIGNLGRDPEQRETRAKGAPFTVLSVATRRSWKNAEGEWESATDWHRVACFNRVNDAAATLHRGDQVFVAGSLVSSKYEREVGKGKKPATVKLTSWQIRANTLRKLNRTAKEPEATASGPSEQATAARFDGSFRKGPGVRRGPFFDAFHLATEPRAKPVQRCGEGSRS